jgi:predicted nucleic acid-binding protein
VREPRYLVDTSVLARARQEVVGNRLEDLSLHGRFWTCRIIDLELVYTTRAGEVPTVAAARRELPEAPVSSAVMNRALDVMERMALSGVHRGAKPVDYVIAAAAEMAGLAVLHYDDDFERIAQVSGQVVTWVAPRGTLDV